MRTLVLLALLLGAPVAAACSLAGPVPGPGSLTLVPMGGGEPIEIAVKGRELGADCRLSNPHALDGTRFVWRELRSSPLGGSGSYEAHVLDLATGERRSLPLAGEHVQSFAVWAGRLVYTTWDFPHGEPPPRVGLRVLDLATGAEERLPFPEGHFVSVSSRGPHVAALLRANGFDGPDTLYVYDMAARAWLVEARPVEQLVGAPLAWGTMMPRGWLLLESREARLLWNVETGEERREDPRRAPPPEWGHGWFVEDDLYQLTWRDGGSHLTRRAFPDGAAEPVEGAPAGRLVGVVPGYYVLGDYSAPHLHPLGRFAWVEGNGLLLGVALLWVGGVVGVPTWRMLRARRP